MKVGVNRGPSTLTRLAEGSPTSPCEEEGLARAWPIPTKMEHTQKSRSPRHKDTTSRVMKGEGMRRAVMVAIVASIAASAPAAQRQIQPWFRAEKVRCLAYMDASDLMLASAPKLRAMGFNCALVNWGGSPLEKLRPLVAAADKAGLRLILVTYFNTDDFLKSHPDVRRYVGPDGTPNPAAPCPTVESFWQTTMLAPALQIASLRAARHPCLAGVLFDMEDYQNLRGTAAGPETYCFCDQCFGAFLKSPSLDTVRSQALSLAPAERYPWVAKNNLWQHYRQFQDDAVLRILRGIRAQVDRVAPSLLFATYPWLYVEPAKRDRLIDWDIRFARALGSQQAPLMLLDEATYTWGYGPHIERQQADYRSLGLNFLAVSGFNLIPAERVWYPGQMADSAYWACKRSDGYWFYEGAWPLLYVPAGRAPAYTFGGKAQQWVERFTAVNKAVAAGKTLTTQPLTLPPQGDYWTLSELYDLKHAPGTQAYVREWRDIGLPWEGGELVMIGRRKGDWLSFTCRMGRPDREEIQAWLTTGPDRAIVQLYVDDQPVGKPVDLYSTVTLPGDKTALGLMDLARGMRTYRFVAVARNLRSTGYSIGLRELWTDDVGYPPPAWMVIAPFDNTGDNTPGYDVVYPPEREIKLAAVYDGKGGQPVRWREVKAQADGYLDLLSEFTARDAVAYCLTHVWVPDDGPREVLLGSGDGGKLWVNGQFVWGEPVGRSPERDENRPRAYFHRGWNQVLFKVLRAHGAWGVYLRLYDPEGKCRWSPTPPEG